MKRGLAEIIKARLAGRLALWAVFWTAALMLFSPGICRPEKPAPIVDEIRVEITRGPGNPERMAQIARNLIYLQEGEVFSDARFSMSVSALKRSGLFEAIEVPDPDWSKDSIVIVFRLKSFARVREIRVSGGFPLLEKEILNAMSMEVGDPCVQEKFSEQEKSIKSLFLKQGYINPQVLLSCDKNGKDGHCIVDVEIDKGRFYRVESVSFAGNQAFSGARLKIRLKTWQSSMLFAAASRFVPEDLERDIKTLRQFYRKKGYAEAEIESEVEKNPDTGAVRIRIRISEGPLYRVSFAGNRAFRDFTLRKDLVFFTQGNKYAQGLRKSIRNMKKRYRKAGYLDAEIKGEEKFSSAGQERKVKNIRFIIREGPRYLVESVSISGNSAFDKEKIKKQMLTAPPQGLHKGVYMPETLEEDIRAINALYLNAGYMNASVEKAVEIRAAQEREGIVGASVKIRIEEGPQTIVKSVSIKGENPLCPDRAAEIFEMKPGTPFRSHLIKADKNALAAAVSEKGYPHVTAEPLIDISRDDTEAYITYTIKPGPQAMMGEVYFEGNFKTRPGILAREMEIKSGAPFSLSELLASQRNIRSLNAVDSAGFKTFGLEQKSRRVDMLAEIREIKPYFVELAAGYDTRRLLYINAAAGNSNLLGLNKQLRAGLEWSQIGYRAELDLNEPRFLGTRISAGTNLYTEKTEELNKDFGVRTYGTSLGFSRPLTPRLTAALNFKFESREQYRTDDQPVPEQDADQYSRRSILAASPGLSYNSTDSFLRPTRGVRASITVDASRGLDNALDDFFRYRLDARWYHSPLDRFTMAFHGRLGHIDPYGGNKRVPDDQLFFLGGTADVRGFSENRLRVDEDNNPVGGKTALLGSMEARFDLGLNFEAALFYDTGAVRDPQTDAGSDEFRQSAGLALRYITPIGPIGGMYGWKLDRKPGESPGAFHFSIGYTF
ncbi:MAG: outer membrane protein assembly factor BamA [Desulfobacteraceae bacterium]|nr:outer membrane protein assembly factor BamA [Desulfobacteraceae bacterium]